MSQVKLVAVACTVSAASISDTRGFDIPLADGTGVHSSVAPQYYFWDENRSPFAADEPSYGVEVAGFIAAREVGSDGAGGVIVSIPDGEVIAVPRSAVVARPQEVPADVPV